MTNKLEALASYSAIRIEIVALLHAGWPKSPKAFFLSLAATTVLRCSRWISSTSSWEPIFFRDTALSRKQLALESEAWSFGKSDACRSFFMRRSTAASGSQSLRANVDCLSAILPAHSKSPSVYLHTSGSFGIASIPSPVILLLTALRLINSPANEFGASS
jgi:hypothetical protein